MAKNLSSSFKTFWEKVLYSTDFVVLFCSGCHSKLPTRLVPKFPCLASTTGELIKACIALLTKLSLEVQEANHSVTFTLTRTPSSATPQLMTRSPPGFRFQTETRMMLLHPADVLKAKEPVLRTSQCDSHQQVEAANFMTSKKLDEYCCNGKYYISC